MAGHRRRASGRLSRSAEFERVYRRGRSLASRFLVVYVFPRERDGALEELGGEPRVGLSVSRKVGGAVERNRVKRLLREAFAAEREHVPAGLDVVIVARPEIGVIAERDGLDGVRRELGALLARAGAASTEPGAAA